MAPASVGSKSTGDWEEINPHVPLYMKHAPWYVKSEEPDNLKHQRKQKKSLQSNIDLCYDRVAKTFLADKYRKEACENCRAMSHNANSCLERPRKRRAILTNMRIAADEKIEKIELDYAGKRDRWNGYDPTNYARDVSKRYEADNEDGLTLGESDTTNFAQVKKGVCGNDGGITGTSRDLRIREDIPKYLLNLDENSAYYDPKSRSMREDPNPDDNPNEKFYAGDNRYRMGGQALEWKQVNVHAWIASQRGGQDMHSVAAPTQAELHYRWEKNITEKRRLQVKTEEDMPRELLFGQSEQHTE